MDLQLFWFICLSISVGSSGHFVQGVTTKSPSNGLKSSSLPPAIETNSSSIIYELLSPKATEPEESIDTSDGQSNKTRNGHLKGKEILNGQEQNQNQYFQGRGPPNRFPPQFNGNNNNYGSQPGGFMPKGLTRPRQPNFGNQANQRAAQQLPNPYEIFNGVAPSSGQNGFHTRTPIKQQQPHNQPVNGYPIGANYPSGLNPNQLHGNVGDQTNQGFGLTDKPSDGYNDQSDETESPEQPGEQSDGVDEETGNEEAENVGGGGEGEHGGNEEVAPHEEGTNDETDEGEQIVGNNGGDESEDEAQEGVDDGANEGDEQPDFDDARAASTDNKGGEASAISDDESIDADGPTTGVQEGGEQDPSNDPDLAQFQNFQGGNFPGDLFPPGILSQQDLQDIQKSIEEQQKKEAEKQKAEEEGATAQNEGGNGVDEENGEGDETSEGGVENGETDEPAAAPPPTALNPYSPGSGYGRQINNQPNLLAINRVLAGRARNPGLMGRNLFNPLPVQQDSPDTNRYDGGFSNRGDFGTGIQDYEYEKPKVNREEDETPNRFRDNSVFNRKRLFPSHRRGLNDDEDEENDQDERIHAPYMRNRFANRFDRFRPRLFGRPGRYNDDLGDYGVHRANSNQQPSIDYKSNPFTIDEGFNPSDENPGNIIKKPLTQGNKQSIINYENEN